MRTALRFALVVVLLLGCGQTGVGAMEPEEERTSLLLSLLCLDHGRIREECRGVLPVERLPGDIYPSQRNQLRLDDATDDVMSSPMDRPSKRGREKVSGFYSNW